MGNSFLMMQGGGAKPTLADTNSYELLADYTVTGSVLGSYTFAGVNLSFDEECVLVCTMLNSQVTGSSYYLFANGNSTTTNYYNQLLTASSTSMTGSRVNDSSFTYTLSENRAFSITKIKLTNNGYFVFQSEVERTFGGMLDLLQYNGSSTFTIPQITSITIWSATSGAIGIGSRFQLYRTSRAEVKSWATS